MAATQESAQTPTTSQDSDAIALVKATSQEPTQSPTTSQGSDAIALVKAATQESAQTPATSQDSDAIALVKAVGEASTVFIGMMAIGGFSYLQGFFGTFRLSLWELNFPFLVVAMIGFSKLAASWAIPAIAAASALVALLLPRRLRNRRSVMVAAIILYSVAIAVGEQLFGSHAATSAVLRTSGALPLVAFASKTKNYDAPRCVEYQTLGAFDCKLIGHFNGIYYYFEPIDSPVNDPSSGEPSTINIVVHLLPESEVIGVKLLGSLDAEQLKER